MTRPALPTGTGLEANLAIWPLSVGSHERQHAAERQQCDHEGVY